MFNMGSSPTLTNVTFSGNSAGRGGGLLTFNGNSPEYNRSPILTNVTFNNNSASQGGGMENAGGDTILTNVTFNDNSATWGGGIFNWHNPTLTNVTFSGNSGMGGDMYNISGIPQIRNTIFWDNTSTIYNNPKSSPIISDSIIQGGCPTGSICTNIINANPKFGTLGNYGGFTQTIPLLGGSSAINAGNATYCPTHDQRGVARFGVCDIGSYEYEYNYTGIYYAKPESSGTGDCQSWENACTLQTALNTVINGDEIWVVAGTHKPTTTDLDPRTATFQLGYGVGVYGGFLGTETTRAERNSTTNVTTLSGEIGIAGIGDNSYHVVTGATGATLDGFTVTAGNANGAAPNNGGGGMYNNSSSPMLMDITFSGNLALDYGGGVYNTSDSNPTFAYVAISGNLAYWQGGGMYNDSSSPTLMNVTFFDNSAENDGGGGMFNGTGSNPILTNVVFNHNWSFWDGGGMYNNMGTSPTLNNVTFNNNATEESGGGMVNFSSSPTITNVTFSGNSAWHGGGMSNWFGSSPVLTNVTFNGNSANSGGGVHNNDSNPQIRNAIVWGNTATTDGPQIYNEVGGSNLSNSVVQDECPAGSTCTNIISADPDLGTLGNYGGFTQTIPLLAGSSAIDAGNDDVCPDTDQRGVARPQGSHCDIGAFELNVYNLFLPLVLR